MLRNSSSGSSLNSSDGPAAASDTTTVLKKGPWTAAEDAILIECVQRHGEGNWNAVQKNCGLARCGKSCRLRWTNHLRPNLKKGSFTHEEEMLVLHLHAQLGNKWARMAAQLPGRTDNEIKNFWNTRFKRRQRAGLPVYPSELQIQQQQQQRIRMRMRPSPSTSPLQSPLPLFKQSPMHSPAMPVVFMPEAPRVNRIVGEGPSTFQFPVTDQMVSGPATMNNIFQYNYGIYGEINVNVNSSPAMPMMYSAAPVKTELPSSQLFNSGGGGGGGGESGCGLLDAMLQEAEVVPRKMVVHNDLIGAVKGFGGDGDAGGSNGGDVKDSFPKLEESPRCPNNAINVKRERQEAMNSISMSVRHDDDDISKLFDMISTPGMPAAPEWYHATADSCDISNGGQSSVVTDDELGLELQHLTSSLAPEADQDWNIGSCPWNNMPGIC